MSRWLGRRGAGGRGADGLKAVPKWIRASRKHSRMNWKPAVRSGMGEENEEVCGTWKVSNSSHWQTGFRDALRKIVVKIEWI